jgi:predicted RNase H-like nuclease
LRPGPDRPGEAGNGSVSQTGGEPFAALNGGTPIAAGKKTWNGQMTRRALLAAAGIRLPGDLAEARAAPADDVLDAAAAAWSAKRIASGQASSLPHPAQPDDAGHPIAIWY